jgi:hypothetical protein
MARLRAEGRAPEARERAHLLEMVRVTRDWLDVSDQHQRRTGVLHNLDLIEGILSRRLRMPAEQAGEHRQMLRHRG